MLNPLKKIVQLKFYEFVYLKFCKFNLKSLLKIMILKNRRIDKEVTVIKYS